MSIESHDEQFDSHLDFHLLNLASPDAPDAERLRAAAQLVVEAAESADGVPPLSEQFLRGLSDVRIGHTHVVALCEGQLVGFAALAPAQQEETKQVTPAQAELVVAPMFRRRGVAKEMVEHITAGAPGLQLWAHGNLEPAQRCAESLGLSKKRSLVVLGLGGQELIDVAGEASAIQMTGGFELLNYTESAERWGQELVDSEWLRVNNEAFSWHPEQGGWDAARLDRARETDWYRPEDVMLLWNLPDRGEPGLAGFHWMKRHNAETPVTAEVYVIGIGEGFRGQKLSKPLLVSGLQHLVKTGSEMVILYVESDNESAMGLYRAYGFEVREEHAVYA